MKRLEFMCWTLEDDMMTNALFKGLYEEWSCVELSILQVCLEGFNHLCEMELSEALP